MTLRFTTTLSRPRQEFNAPQQSNASVSQHLLGIQLPTFPTPPFPNAWNPTPLASLCAQSHTAVCASAFSLALGAEASHSAAFGTLLAWLGIPLLAVAGTAVGVWRDAGFSLRRAPLFVQVSLPLSTVLFLLLVVFAYAWTGAGVGSIALLLWLGWSAALAGTALWSLNDRFLPRWFSAYADFAVLVAALLSWIIVGTCRQGWWVGGRG
jgi:hypothetical protein